MKNHTGYFNKSTMTRRESIAYMRWVRQRQRCNNKKCTGYKDYGGRGIKVEYDSRSFVGWFLNKTKNILIKDIKRFHVGRIDHSKNYTLDNIELVSISENTKERNTRHYYRKNIIRHPVVATHISGLKCFFTSINIASKFTKVNTGDIWKMRKEIINIRAGWKFQSSSGSI